MYRYIIIILLLLPLHLNAKVTVSIANDLNDKILQSEIEKTMSAFLTEANKAQKNKRELQLGKLSLPKTVKESITRLWENHPFKCDDDKIVETCNATQTGYQVRNIPILLYTDNATEQEEYKELVFNFDKTGNLQNIFLALPAKEFIRNYTKISRYSYIYYPLTAIEQLWTSYHAKDIDFIKSFFADNFLIKDGVIEGTNYPDDEKGWIGHKDRKKYLSQIDTLFSSSKDVSHVIDEIEMVRYPINYSFCGVSFHISSTSDTQCLSGYVFQVWDFTNEDEIKIHVNIWQSDKENGERLSPEERYSLKDFDI